RGGPRDAARARMNDEAQRIRDAYARRAHDERVVRGGEFVVAERRAIIREAVVRQFGARVSSIDICDIGCGAGGDLVSFCLDFGIAQEHLAGTELLPGPLAEASRALPEADLRLVDGFELPWPDASFDLTWASMAFSSIMDAASRRDLFGELLRVTRRGGLVAIYDFRVRKPTNPDVVAMTARRIRDLGVVPAQRLTATPFIPLLPVALRLPAPLRRATLPLLPRTHAIWLWRR
ncbi:MAG: class I SAM-dependent methyltransferase, partial [Chloroflexota bacterium]